MTNLYQQWRDIAEAERTQEAGEKFWNDYFEAETENYKKLLAEKSDLAVYEANLPPCSIWMNPRLSAL